MKNVEFIDKCIEIVRDYTIEHFDKSEPIPNFDVFPVYVYYAFKNHNAILSTTLDDGMLFELTYDSDKKELYLYTYKKFETRCIEN